MEQPFPTRDPIEGLRFTFKTDEAAAAANPRPEKESAEFGEPDGLRRSFTLVRRRLPIPARWGVRRSCTCC